jgi:two-component system LytT family sensor kinase
LQDHVAYLELIFFMRFIKFISLWLILTICFSIVNSSYVFTQILVQAINSALFTIGFYLSYEFLAKPFLYKGRITKFIIIYLLLIAVLSLVSILSVYQVYVYEKNKFLVDNYWNEPVFFTSNYILILLVTSSLLSFRFLKDKMQVQLQFENLEKEKISTELDFLKAQINPHFLFNSLNNILFQIDKSNTNARETLLKFSEMLRYQLYDCSNDLIEIEKELQYIRNFIEIQMLRKSTKYSCSLTVSDSVKNFSIAPLLLIPFIENAFKHISNHVHGENSIRINMDYREGQFLFSILNDADDVKSIEISENKGIGLSNVKRRLELLYPGKYNLDIKEGNKKYSVNITLNVT